MIELVDLDLLPGHVGGQVVDVEQLLQPVGPTHLKLLRQSVFNLFNHLDSGSRINSLLKDAHGKKVDINIIVPFYNLNPFNPFSPALAMSLSALFLNLTKLLTCDWSVSKILVSDWSVILDLLRFLRVPVILDHPLNHSVLQKIWGVVFNFGLIIFLCFLTQPIDY